MVSLGTFPVNLNKFGLHLFCRGVETVYQRFCATLLVLDILAYVVLLHPDGTLLDEHDCFIPVGVTLQSLTTDNLGNVRTDVEGEGLLCGVGEDIRIGALTVKIDS